MRPRIPRDRFLRASPCELQENAEVKVSPFETGHNYEALKYDFYLFGVNTGEAVIRFGDEIKWCTFFPVDELPRPKYQWKMHGLGTLFQVMTLQEMAKENDLGSIVTHDRYCVTEERKAHLRKMGLQPGMTLEEYLQKSIAYANSKGFDFQIS